MVREDTVTHDWLTVFASGRDMLTLISGRSGQRCEWKRAWAPSQDSWSVANTCSNNSRRGRSTTLSPNDDDVNMRGLSSSIRSIDTPSSEDVTVATCES